MYDIQLSLKNELDKITKSFTTKEKLPFKNLNIKSYDCEKIICIICSSRLENILSNNSIDEDLQFQLLSFLVKFIKLLKIAKSIKDKSKSQTIYQICLHSKSFIRKHY